MDKLKNQKGYIILEALVGIIILGLVVTFSVMFFNQIFANSKILLKSDALLLAKQEIDTSINFRTTTDTSYFNQKGNLKVIRNIKAESNIYKAVVTVASDSGKKEILSLSVLYIK
ncbi:MAG: type II secretion system protein [Ignavibacteriae bacterium]|nr:type II secretion system protein [Ignavibacteriota bacterium]